MASASSLSPQATTWRDHVALVVHFVNMMTSSRLTGGSGTVLRGQPADASGGGGQTLRVHMRVHYAHLRVHYAHIR